MFQEIYVIDEQEKLTEELNEASYAYYNTDNTIMSDSELEILLNNLNSSDCSSGE